MVKLNVMGLPGAPGKRSPGWIVRETPVTWPPSGPEAEPETVHWSMVVEEFDVETVIPFGLPAVVDAPVNMLSSSVMTPAGMAELPTVRLRKACWVCPAVTLTLDVGPLFNCVMFTVNAGMVGLVPPGQLPLQMT